MSRVLNDRPGVSESTKQAVLTALDVLGYERPSKLRGERARLVGLVLPELQNPIFPAFAEVVGGALAQQGFTPVLCTQTAGGISEAEYVDLLLEQHVSGVVFVGGNYAQRDASHGHYSRLSARNLPVVLINASLEELPFPRVACDDAKAMELAMNHLLSLGHAKIGLVLGPRDHIPSERKLPRRPGCRGARRSGVGPRPGGACRLLVGERSCGSGTALVARGYRRPLRKRPLGSRGGSCRAQDGSGYAVECLCCGLRRLIFDELHRPANDHRASADRADGTTLQSTFWSVRCLERTWCWTSCCSSPSWWFEARLVLRPLYSRGVSVNAHFQEAVQYLLKIINFLQ